MKKKINELLKTITPQTPIDEVINLCDSVEDVELIMANLPKAENKSVQLSEEIKQAALSLVNLTELNAAEITTSYIQKNLLVTYPQAIAIVEWLKAMFIYDSL